MKKKLAFIIALAIMLVAALPALASEVSVLKNGGFEELRADGMPEFWSFHSYEGEYNGRTDNASASCEDDQDRGKVLHIAVLSDDDAAVYQTVKVEPLSYYKLSCFIKTKGVSNGAGANIALRDLIAVSEGLYGDNDWTKIELIGRTGPGQYSMTVSCRVGGYSATGRGEAWFDSFTVEKVSKADGEVVPFYTSAEEETNTSSDNSKTWIVFLVISLVLVAIAGAVALPLIIISSGKKGKAKSGAAIPPIESYAQDKARDLPKPVTESFFSTNCTKLPAPTDLGLHLSKLDRILILALTGVYAVIALIRLGTLNFPKTRWEGDSGDSIRIEFGKSVKLSDIWQVSGISHVKYKLVTDDGTEIMFTESSGRDYGHMYRWASINKSSVQRSGETTGVTLTIFGGDTSRPNEPDLALYELAFFDKDGELVPFTAPEGASALGDEQGTVPETPSYYNGMYFDELYHGRTALEHIENRTVYEWTHPPLGKLIIAVGILIFGMNPFGWRIMGVLFGIAMVPVLYLMAKRLLKRTDLAFFSTFLFTFDFMHFTQTRIATIDVYGVFFILLMTYFMLEFISMDIGDSTASMLRPLALSGICFGLGCASKWIGIYTGAGLAILFFVKLVIMIIRSAKLKKHVQNDKRLRKEDGTDYLGRQIGRSFALCGWCVIFFVIVPILIYAGSYFRYYTAQWLPARQAQIYASEGSEYASKDDVKLDLADAVKTYVNGVIKNQKDIFNYHSRLKSEHSASSTWWMWIFDLRPTWFYLGGQKTVNLFGSEVDLVGTISTFGNPLVWVPASLMTFALPILIPILKKKFPNEIWFILVCFASSFLPWALVPRSTYAYHYFASVPFIVLAAGYTLGAVEEAIREKRAKTGKKAPSGKLRYVWMALTLLLFGIFFPVISGIEAPRGYIAALQWVPFHKFEIVNENDEVQKTYRIGWTFTSYEPANVNKKNAKGEYIYITRIKQ